jgi:hypothetical protein
MNVVLQNIRATEGARKVAQEEGERLEIAGAHLTWKVQGEDSDVVASFGQKEPFSALPLSEAMLCIAQIGLRHDMLLRSTRRKHPRRGRP